MSPNDGDSSRVVVVVVVVVVLVVVVLEVVVVVLVVVVVVVVVVAVTSSSSSSSISISSSSSSRSSVSRSRRLGGESNREIVFVSFVRACEAVCACEGRCCFPSLGLRTFESTPCVPVPFPLCRNVKVIEKLF